MPESTLTYARRPAHKADLHESWRRPDPAFFAAGACHILAFALRSRSPHRSVAIVVLEPREAARGLHVYAACERRAFDFNGWGDESALLRANERAYRAVDPAWSYRRWRWDRSLEELCARFACRRPEQFFADPWPRALAYISRLESRTREVPRGPKGRRPG